MGKQTKKDIPNENDCAVLNELRERMMKSWKKKDTSRLDYFVSAFSIPSNSTCFILWELFSFLQENRPSNIKEIINYAEGECLHRGVEAYDIANDFLEGTNLEVK